MAGLATAKAVFTVLTLISSIGVRLAPTPDFYAVHKRKATGPVQLLPVVALATNNAFSMLYAYAVNDFVPLFVTNCFGFVTSLFFIGIYHRYCQDRAYVYKMCAVGAALAGGLAIYTFLGVSGSTSLTRSQVSSSLGWVMAVSTSLLFASPLATVKTVIQTKSAASIPFTLCLMYEINAILWLAYAIIISDWFVAAPNMVGVPLGILQLSLCAIYRPSKDSQSKIVYSDGAMTRGSISIDIDGIASPARSDFIELVSPHHRTQATSAPSIPSVPDRQSVAGST